MRTKVFEITVKKKPSSEMRQVVKMLSIGRTQQEIADHFGFNRRTLESNLSKMYLEFGCENATHLACMFLRQKLID